MCPRCARANRTGTPGSLPSISTTATRGNCSMWCVELLVLEGQTQPRDQLTELVELGRLERDGITRLNVHRSTILADGAPPLTTRLPNSGRTTRRRDLRDRAPDRGSGGRARGAHRPAAWPRRRPAPTCGRPAPRARAPSWSRWRRSPTRSCSWYSSHCARVSRSERRNFQFFSGSSIRACSRARCSSFEMWRNTFTIEMPSSWSIRSKARMWR